MQTRARREIARLERGLVVLEIIVGIAPLLGLVGTILGMMTAFGNVGQAGQIDPAELAKGISLILRATLLGLLIAIPSLIFWSYYSKKVESLHRWWARRGRGTARRVADAGGGAAMSSGNVSGSKSFRRPSPRLPGGDPALQLLVMIGANGRTRTGTVLPTGT